MSAADLPLGPFNAGTEARPPNRVSFLGAGRRFALTCRGTGYKVAVPIRLELWRMSDRIRDLASSRARDLADSRPRRAETGLSGVLAAARRPLKRGPSRATPTPLEEINPVTSRRIFKPAEAVGRGEAGQAPP